MEPTPLAAGSGRIGAAWMGKGICVDAGKKQALIDFVHFLGEVFGRNVEVVLHIIEPDDAYVAAIVNGHVTGRDETAPLTGLALQFIRDRVYERQDAVLNYKGVSKGSDTIQSSTYFIKSPEGELEAMLCFNIDVSPYLDLSRRVLEAGNVGAQFLAPSGEEGGGKAGHVHGQGLQLTEYFSDTLRDVVHSVIPAEVLESDAQVKPKQRAEAIAKLYDRGLFEIKGAVAQVAEILKMSEPSVYRYLKQVTGKR